MKCIIIDDDLKAQLLIKQLIMAEENIEILDVFTNPVEAINFLKKNNVDLIFLDVEMPEMTGMEFLEAIEGNEAKVILTTSHEKYALDAFNYRVEGYLVKPIRIASFKRAIKKLESIYEKTIVTKKDDEQLVFIKKGTTIHKINYKEISYIECLGDYVSIFTDLGKFTIHGTMKEMEDKFNQDGFMRIHRSYIIQKNKIETIQDDNVFIQKKPIPIGKTYKQDIYRNLNFI